LPIELASETFAHRLDGPCNCGRQHGRATVPARGKPAKAYPTAADLTKALAHSLGPLRTRWSYRGANGVETMRVLRFEDAAGNKTYRPAHKNGVGWVAGDPPGPLPLYHLPDLNADRSAAVWVFEGEKCADLARELGLVATTSSHGSRSAGKTDWSPLAGRDVAIVPDADDAGEVYATDVAAILGKLGSRVRVVRLPGLAEGEDLEQWLGRGGTAEALNDLAASALASITVPPPPDAATVAASDAPGRPNEAPDDPFRLARLYRDRRCSHPDGPTVRYWRGEFHRWDRSAYRAVPDAEIRAELGTEIKADFDRINIEDIARHSGDKARPTVRKVTEGLKGNALGALASLTLLSTADTPEAPAWISGPAPWPASEILPTRNALVHLRSLVAGEPCTIDPTPRLFSTWATDYDFDVGAAAPETWLRFLGSQWGDDPESIATLQEWFGYCLTPDTRQQKVLALIGPKRAGKDTIARTLAALVGKSNVAGPTLSGLATNFGMAPLIGKPLAVISDARLSGRSDTAAIVERLLTISGEGTLTIDRKHREPWTGKLPTRFVLISNELPKLADSSGALASRLVLLRLTRSFYDAEDKGLFDKILPELPGILLWAIAGWQRLSERGRFVQPESGADLVRDMEDLSSPVGAFVREHLDVSPGLEAPVPDVYARWRTYCEAIGRREPGDAATFGRNVRAVLPQLDTATVRRAGERVRVFRGIGLKDPDSRLR